MVVLRFESDAKSLLSKQADIIENLTSIAFRTYIFLELLEFFKQEIVPPNYNVSNVLCTFVNQRQSV